MVELNRPLHRQLGELVAMKNLSLCVSTISFIYAGFIQQVACAEMICDEQSTNTHGSMLCINTSKKGTSTVLFRNMLPWDANSGVTIIDICPGAIPANLEPYSGCVRRYCTRSATAIAFRLTPIVVPVAPVAGALGISFAHTHFEILCESFVRHDSSGVALK